MGNPNWENQTMFTGDNLDIMRGMNSASVDLIYLDPPFNSNANYAAPIGSAAAGAAFKDTWGLDDINLAWHGEIKHDYPGLYALLTATREIHSDSMMSYLIYMAIRLMEMKRLLKPTGSIYLHCDPTAVPYLRLLMDAVFGAKSYRNELVWKRTSGKKAKNKFPSNHDTVLYYALSSKKAVNTVYVQHDPDYIAKYYKKEDKHGRYRVSDLTAPETREGDSGMPWRGIDVTKRGRHWAAPSNFPKHVTLPLNWEELTTQAKLDFLDNSCLIHWPSKGSMPGFKRYLSTSKGAAMTDVVIDVSPLASNEKEKTDYPTQKPLKLIRRFIRASSNQGDIVFDPFCGCATACIAAEMEGRQWIGIDISSKAADLVQDRMYREIGLFYKGARRSDIPKRDDLGKIIQYNDIRNKRYLYGEQGGYCNGCEHHFELRNFTVDHIIPKAHGGTDHISNLQLLCGACNSMKGTRSQEELLVMLTDKGWIKRRKAA